MISGMEEKIVHYPVECEFMQGLYDGDRLLTTHERLSIRHENDRKFLEIGLAVVDGDIDAVLAGFFGLLSGVDDLNYCFGTTLLALAIRSGTSAMLQLLLRSTRVVRRSHLYVYLRLAMARQSESGQFTTILLDRLGGSDETAKHRFATDLLEKAIWGDDTGLFDVIIHWINTSACAPKKLPVLEWAFNYLLWPRKTGRRGRRRANYPWHSAERTLKFLTDRKPPGHTNYAGLDVVPGHCFGRTYRELLAEWRIILTALNIWTPNTDYYWCVHEKRWIKRVKPRYPMSFTPLFLATAKGLLNWVDWLLWAGADPRHLEGDASLLDCARIADKVQEVAILLKIHGWDALNLEVRPGEPYLRTTTVPKDLSETSKL
ncbi:hypothetical protein NX059_005604 [Plenodomus lindquistii]|nr:hypothetical protein NX059_005604 [Plenodomus lindquistii]